MWLKLTNEANQREAAKGCEAHVVAALNAEAVTRDRCQTPSFGIHYFHAMLLNPMGLVK